MLRKFVQPWNILHFVVIFVILSYRDIQIVIEGLIIDRSYHLPK